MHSKLHVGPISWHLGIKPVYELITGYKHNKDAARQGNLATVNRKPTPPNLTERRTVYHEVISSDDNCC